VRTAWLLVALAWTVGCGGSVDLGGSDGYPPAVEAGPTAEGGASPEAAGDEGSDAPLAEASVDESADATVEAQGGAPADASGLEAGPDAPPEAAPVDAGAGTCDDHVRDGTETDVDCGGSCSPCGPRKSCLRDSDCSATASGCDAPSGGCFCDTVSATCVYSHCYDQTLDGDETGPDCGGSACGPCAKGQGCLVDGDCTSQACDGIAFVCDSSQCSDHRVDGDETDVDCGGAVCSACASGQRCMDNFDCDTDCVVATLTCM
jgi:hypothetical protein